MTAPSPPAYAWDWFARQRLLWREARSRLADMPGPTGARYGLVATKADALGLLRADYPDNDAVRRVVDGVVADLAFLGRTDRPFEALGMRAAPRGLRWWWSTITGEQLTTPRQVEASAIPRQLELPDVLGGYGDP